MPLFYRAMTKTLDGKPAIGPNPRALGVRTPPHETPDIRPDERGNVAPETGGMSVAPSWRQLPPWRIPKRLSSLCAGARGKNEDACYKLGAGAFEPGAISERLFFRPDAPDHGLVEPATVMPLSDFQAALAATQNEWQIDEN
jgi:hypothetical protein